jgi:hypothetical protein
VTVKSIKKTVRINLLQGLVVCSYSGRRLNIQTPKNCATYYRENSHHRGYHDCPHIGQGVRAEVIDSQVAALIRSIHLPENWEPIVRQMFHEQHDQVDPEAERRKSEVCCASCERTSSAGCMKGKNTSVVKKSLP